VSGLSVDIFVRRDGFTLDVGLEVEPGEVLRCWAATERQVDMLSVLAGLLRPIEAGCNSAAGC